ncbi:hypothetical protein ACQE3E_14365 [Methylomonas sp. MED-D]|uniref:Lipoprotein n=1 Tax=Methylomonas koyamae TaxID=702114 RepID=A0A177NSW8_9GAMM|nr:MULTISPECIES: hypothetical protein [Methylomonas]MDT4331395.1 hypothetical protein [Methylomonas sp. MV1]NJA05407.1 hypothetical protein [Methylococcaceae bacterium WWC4]OAI20150.1 hypothetical protein A1355_03060 [Methylomonas koyamae]OHX36102.1 hypothetical protein BJL95_09925 [Methylomonas sp. LWB]
MKRLILWFAALMILAGCSTTGHFKVPDGSQLYLYKRPEPVQISANGEVTTKPYFWTAAGMPPGGGIPYKLEKNGKVLKEGKLRAKFRVVSIFWPPFAIIYWPIGLNPDITYDLINDKQE